MSSFLSQFLQEMNAHIVIRMDNSVMEHDSYIGYDSVNLLSDVGGALGLFMGWSIAFCTDFIAKFLKSKTFKSMFTSMILLVLVIGKAV